MTMQAEQAAIARGSFEVRGGKCPECGTPFDDAARPPHGDERWCPKCKQHRLGALKAAGILKGRQQ